MRFFYFDKVGSTNEAAKSINGPFPFAVIAKEQTGGKGRLGKSFYSPIGGLYLSIVFDPDDMKIKAEYSTAAACVGARRIIEKACGKSIKIKWVNDLYSEGRKVSGILTEAITKDNKIERIIIGIGINLILPENGFPDEIKDRASYIGYTGSPEELAKAIADGIYKEVHKDKEEILSEYRKGIMYENEIISVKDYSDHSRTVTGKFAGIDQSFRIMLETENGIIYVGSGEIV